MRMKPSLNFSDAQRIMESCLKSAGQLGASVSVSVTDDAGNLLHFCRMDGARSHTIDRATQKARIAASVGVTTGMIEEMYKNNPISAQPGFPGRGGVPLLFEGECAGGIGVSGSIPEIDETIANFGAESLLSANIATPGQ